MTIANKVSLLVALAAIHLSAHAQDFSGRYTLSGVAEAATLVFEHTSESAYVGTLSNQGFDVALEGEVVDGSLQGMIDDGSDSIAFVAELQDQGLVLSLVELDVFGQPMLESAQMLLFDRQATSSGTSSAAAVTPTDDSGAVTMTAPTAEGPGAGARDVSVNSRALSADQLAELESLYGVTPLPGDYWYDAVSGLYGAVGFQAFGFMYPGHDLGPLARDASAGDTSVFINGRELPQAEWLIWSYMLGTPIQIGAYWLDAQGNAGYEGNPIPLVNLYVAAQQNAYSGQGGSGDNFWSTRFSAGNYDSGNTRGYVSVPGHGPVGYGF